MKKIAKIAAIAAVAAVMAGSNVSFAAEEKNAKTPEFGTWEYQWALETGNLPSETGKPAAKPDSYRDIPTIELGGLVYRVGIDTP